VRDIAADDALHAVWNASGFRVLREMKEMPTAPAAEKS